MRDAVREKAHGASAMGPFLAELRSVLGGVKPAFVNAVGIGAAVAAKADATLVIRTWHGKVAYRSGITATSVFCGVSKRTGTPIVDVALAASSDLEIEHAEVIGGVFWGVELRGGKDSGWKALVWGVGARRGKVELVHDALSAETALATGGEFLL
jgi:hypothetical protein